MSEPTRSEIRAVRSTLSRMAVLDSGCWVPPGGRSSDGYPVRGANGRTVHVARLLWAFARGESLRDLDPNLELAGCAGPGGRECVRPEHLTPSHRVGRRPPKGAELAARTHCPRGHELAGGNLHAAMLRKGERDCRTCYAARRRAKRKGITLAEALAEPGALRWVQDGNPG